MARITVAELGGTRPRSVRAEAAGERLLVHGYTRLPGALGTGLVERVRQEIDAQAVGRRKAGGDRTLLDGYPRLDSHRRVLGSADIRALALAVCGPDACVHMVKGAVRVAGEGELGAHTDTGAITRSPFARPGQFLTVHIICEPVRLEHGPTFFVEGSHRLLRDPTEAEAARAPRVWVDAEPGDLVCWLGETWHGRLTRTAPGARVSLFAMFAAADALDTPHPPS